MSIGERWARITDWARRGGGRLMAVLFAALAMSGAYVLGRNSGKDGGVRTGPKEVQKPSAPQGPPSVTLDSQQVQYAGLRVDKALQVTLPTRLTTTGTVAANLNGQAQVSSRLSGKIVAVYANVGQTVRAGQALVLIASPDLSQAQAAYHDAILRRELAQKTLTRQLGLAQLGAFSSPPLEQARISFEQSQGEIQSAKDSVNSAQDQVAQAQAQLRFAQKTYVRGQALYSAQLIARQDLEQEQANAQQAQAALDYQQANLRTAVDRQLNAQRRGQIAARQLARQTAIRRGGFLTNQQVVDARSAYEMAAHEIEASAVQVRLLGGVPMDEADPGGGMLTVVTPISGRVSSRLAMVGETVTPDKPLFSILNLGSVVVQMTVYQEDLVNVRVGQPISVVCNTAPGRTFHGYVSVISAALDDATRTAKVDALVKNPGGALRPGVYVTGTISGAARHDVVAVPEYAVQTLDDRPVVFTPGDKMGVYQATPVKTGVTVNGLTQITRGLVPGAPVVTKNAFLLKSQLKKDSL